MSEDVSVTITDKMSPKIHKLVLATHDFKEPLKTCGLYLYKSFGKQFAAEGTPSWQPLKDATLMNRRGNDKALSKYLTAKNREGKSKDPGYKTQRLSKMRQGERVSLMREALSRGSAYQTFIDTFSKSKKYSVKPRTGFMHKILQDTRRLFRSYVQGAAGDAIYKLAEYSLTMGSNLIYARVQQKGWKDKNIPARPLDILPSDVNAFQKILANYVKKQVQ